MDILAFLELPVLDFIQAHLTGPMGDRFWVFITHLGDKGLIWIFFTALLLIFPKTRSIGKMSALALLFSLLITNGLLKNLVGRPRPFAYKEVALLIESPWDHSFPSGHTSASFAFAYVIYKTRAGIVSRKLFYPVFALACMMAFSRLYLYVHFPSDVIAGVLAGCLAGWLGIWTYKKRPT